MLELNIASLIYTAIVGIGLIGAQAALTKKNFMLTVSSPNRLTTDGYTKDAIEGMMLNELEEMLKTRSVIKAPIIHSVADKSFISSLADMAHMGDLSLAMQDALGNAPYRVTANFVIEDGKPMAQVYGNSARGLFHQLVPSGTHVRDLVKRTAHAAIRNIDPYFLALHYFELGSSGMRSYGHGIDYVDTLANQELTRRRLPPTARAAFINLKGLVRLDKGDIPAALAAFSEALDADPDFAIARVNRAFALAMLDRHPEAIEVAQELLGPPARTDIKQVLMAAETLIAVSKWVHGDHVGAETYFARAAKREPNATTPVLYWSRMVASTGRQDASLQKISMSHKAHSRNDDLYAEIAMLYYWVGEKDAPASIVRRAQPVPSRDELSDPSTPAPATPAAPAVAAPAPAASK